MNKKITPLTVSRNYIWDEKADEFIHLQSNDRYSAEEYENKIRIFEDRVRGWFLDVALNLVSGSEQVEFSFNSEDYVAPNPKVYVALSVALAYIEGVEQYRCGEKTPDRQAGEWFRKSAKRIFPATCDDAITRLYKEARNGLFHSGFTYGKTYINCDYKQALELEALESVEKKLKINPKKVIEAVIDDFNRYILELRDSSNSDLGRKFLKLWDERWENS